MFWWWMTRTSTWYDLNGDWVSTINKNDSALFFNSHTYKLPTYHCNLRCFANWMNNEMIICVVVVVTTLWKNKNLLTLEKNFVKITHVVKFSAEGVDFAEFLCKFRVRVNFCNFHTVQPQQPQKNDQSFGVALSWGGHIYGDVYKNANTSC